MTYRGRFAPSPSGPLHIGSIVSAVGSWCAAKSRQGKWLLRIDDLDTVRSKLIAIDQIQLTLEKLGLEWDEPVVFQSRNIKNYSDALAGLKRLDLVYQCACSRKDILRASLNAGVDGPIYRGTCKEKNIEDIPSTSTRVIVTNEQISFHDTLRGTLESKPSRDFGDFIVKRADGIYSYHLATVIDDYQMRVTHIVRGADLLNSSFRQAYLMGKLNYSQPTYCHLPLVLNTQGKKISKTEFANPVDTKHPSKVLHKALSFLGQNPPDELKNYPKNILLNWAVSHWCEEKIERIKAKNK